MGYGQPQLGVIRLAKDIGYKGSHHYMWCSCVDCGKERWVSAPKDKPRTERCQSCYVKISKIGEVNRGKHAKGYKGSRKTHEGYKLVYLRTNDFFAPMRNSTRYVLEHRLVMAKSLGRCLHPFEIVHHKNHIRDDNRIANLQLISDDRHKQLTIMEERIKFLESRVTTLEVENILLKSKSFSLELEDR